MSHDAPGGVSAVFAETPIADAGAASLEHESLGVRLKGLLVRPAAAPAALALIYAMGVTIFALAARGHGYPDVFPDEIFYGRLSQNFALGHGLSWRGNHQGLPPLYPVVLSLAWHGGSAVHQYAVAKLIGCLLACSASVPVWLLARRMVNPWLALIPATLAIAGAWMEMTGQLVSENLAYPVSTAALCATVMAVRNPGWKWFLIAGGLSAVGILTRAELIVLPAVLVLAVAADVLRQRRGTRLDRLVEHPWPVLATVGAVIAVLGVTLLVHPFTISVYYLGQLHAPLGQVLSRLGQNALSLVAMTVVVPIASTIALGARARNWRDDDAGPLLCVTAAALVAILVVTARFDAIAAGGAIERYLVYLMPLFMLGLLLAVGRVDRRVLLGAAAILGAALLAVSTVWNYIEQQAVFGAVWRLTTVGFSVRSHLGIALAGLLFGLTGSWFVARKRVVGAAAIVLLGMVLQGQASQQYEKQQLAKYRPLYVPPHPDWVARATQEPTAMLNINGPAPVIHTVNFYTEFFSPNINAAYDTLYTPIGGTCRLGFDARGYFVSTPGRCSKFPRDYVAQQGFFTVHLYDQRVLGGNPVGGTLLEVPTRRPRLLSLLGLPCTPRACPNAVQIALFLDKPGSVQLRFAAPPRITHLQVGSRTYTMVPGRPTTVRFKVRAGRQGWRLPTDIAMPRLAPKLLDATLVQGRTVTRLD